MAEGTHSYYEWQISTLMLAYDVAEPLARDDDAALLEREHAVREELARMVHAVLPRDYLDHPTSDFPPAIVAMLTRATLRRASEIAGA